MNQPLIIDVAPVPVVKPDHALPIPDWFFCRDRFAARCQAHWLDCSAGVLDAETLLTALVPLGEREGRWSENYNPAVTIRISDMLYSMGAKHYYGAVLIDRVRFGNPDEPNMCSCCPGDPDFVHTVEVYRPLDAAEIRRDPDRYKHYKPGDYYAGHDTPQDALRRCLAWVKRHTRGFEIRLDADEDYKLKL